jgi:hypothetical protein
MRIAPVQRQLLGTLLGLLLPLGTSRGQVRFDPTEVESAFVLNLVRFIEWPPQAFQRGEDRIRILVVGDDLLAQEILSLSRGKVFGNRQVDVSTVAWDKQLPLSHLLIMKETDARRVRRIIESSRGQSQVTLGTTREFTGSGGTIRFFIEGERLSFEINMDAAKRSDIKVSAKLLLLARRIIGSPGTP